MQPPPTDSVDDPRLDRRARRGQPAAFSASCARGMVAAAHYLAADAGKAMLEQGGNAADAAVATAYALAVCEPAASGLGGMAMAVVHDRATSATRMLDGACRAPAAATPVQVKASHRYRGHRAVAVPTAPALLEHLRQQYGTLARDVVMRPAIDLARGGVRITPLQHGLIGQYAGVLRTHNAGALFLDADGQPHPVGHRLRQPELADTLEQIARGGVAEFYTGAIGQRICADMRRHDGFLGWEDLSTVPWPRDCAPISVPFGDQRLYTAGPPAGGVALAQLARMRTALGAAPDLDDPAGALAIASMIRRARRDRRRHGLGVGNRDLGTAVELISAQHAQRTMQAMQAELAVGETSHICAMDGGVAVAMTMSIERSFGSACIADGLGFLYNGYLRGFKVEATTHPHYLRPGGPARSNAAPTLLFDADGPVTAIGSTGSERMVSGIFTTLLRLERQDAFAAVAGPRLHCTPEGEVLIEQAAFASSVVEALGERFALQDVGPHAFKMGGLQLVTRTGETWTGVADPRRDGGVAGVD